jgi:hypothetical protein
MFSFEGPCIPVVGLRSNALLRLYARNRTRLLTHGIGVGLRSAHSIVPRAQALTSRDVTQATWCKGRAAGRLRRFFTVAVLHHLPADHWADFGGHGVYPGHSKRRHRHHPKQEDACRRQRSARNALLCEQPHQTSRKRVDRIKPSHMLDLYQPHQSSFSLSLSCQEKNLPRRASVESRPFEPGCWHCSHRENPVAERLRSGERTVRRFCGPTPVSRRGSSSEPAGRIRRGAGP